MGRRVLLLVNRSKPEVVAALDDIRSLVTAGGGTVAQQLDATIQDRLDHAFGADLILVLGGDGTLLSQCRRSVHLNLPLMGVNFGKLGFMAEFDMPALRLAHTQLFDGRPLPLADRAMMDVTVIRASGEHEPCGVALNDAVITAGPPFRMIEVAVSIDGDAGPTILGDGLIVATPIGSTAYNASAGGPIISPDVEALVLTAIAAHSLAFRPVVISPQSTIELSLLRCNDDPDSIMGTMLVIDGQVGTRLRRGDRVLVRLHAQRVHFVRNALTRYWHTLVTKMHWAARPSPAPLLPSPASTNGE